MSVAPIKMVRIIKSVGSSLLPTVNILAVGNAGAPGEQPTVNQLLPALTPGGINPQQFTTVQASPSYQPGLKNLIVPLYYPEPDIDMNFYQGLYYGTALSGLTVSRASLGTDLLPTSPAGASYNTFANNIARITPGVGLLIEEARTNYLLNSTAPQTQTTASLGTGTYTLWVNGSGSATTSAGTATATGYGAATQGSPNVIVVTVAGTVTVTVAGSLNAFQLELNPSTVSYGSSLIITAGATATRAADVISLTSLPTFGSSYSMYASAIPQAPVLYNLNQMLLSLDDGTSNNRLNMYRNNSNAYAQCAGFSGGSQYWSSGNSALLTQAALAKVAVSAAPNNQNLEANGGSLTSNATGTPATPTQAHIGCREDGILFGNAYIARVALWTTAISNSALASITSGTGP